MSLRFRPNRQVPQGVGGILLVGYAFDFLAKTLQTKKLVFSSGVVSERPPRYISMYSTVGTRPIHRLTDERA